MKLKVIDEQWLDQQIEWAKQQYALSEDRRTDGYYDGYEQALMDIKQQLFPIKEHIKSAFKAGADNWAEMVEVIRRKGIACHVFVNPNLDDYLKQQGYE